MNELTRDELDVEVSLEAMKNYREALQKTAREKRTLEQLMRPDIDRGSLFNKLVILEKLEHQAELEGINIWQGIDLAERIEQLCKKDQEYFGGSIFINLVAREDRRALERRAKEAEDRAAAAERERDKLEREKADRRAQIEAAGRNLAELAKEKAVIDLDMIELIHRQERQQDGYISFCRAVNGRYNLGGVRVAELREYLPQLLPWLLEDAYFSLNGFYGAKPYANQTTGLPDARRKKTELRYLNTCYVDLDFYKAGLNWGAAVGVVLQAMDNDVVPAASIIGRSGRGMYLLWLLRGAQEGTQQRAFPAEQELYRKINQALYTKLNEYQASLKADPIFDESRIFRVPGSINTKSDEPVLYQVLATKRGLAPEYTLIELAEQMQLSARVVEIQAEIESGGKYTRPIKNPGSCPARRRGRMATGEYRLEDFRAIYQHQGGFNRGFRRRALTLYCEFARAAGHGIKLIEATLYRLAAGCHPAYPSDESDTPIKNILIDTWNGKTKANYNYKLAKFFQVDRGLAEQLGLHSIIPRELADERKKSPGPREQARRDRLEAMRNIIAEHPGNVPSVRNMVKRLEAEGIEARKSTVAKELRELLSDLQGGCPTFVA